MKKDCRLFKSSKSVEEGRDLKPLFKVRRFKKKKPDGIIYEPSTTRYSKKDKKDKNDKNE